MKRIIFPSFFEIAPWLVLLIGLTASLTGWQAFHTEEISQAQERFELEMRRHKRVILQRMQTYEQILRSGVSLFDASEQVNRAEWRQFAASLRLPEYFPGIQGFGWSIFIPPHALEDHLRALRAEGFPDYQIRPPGPREIYTSIIYLEPFGQRNQRAFGYDMFSEPVRREAMIRARDSGLAALSGKVTLVQETDEEKQAGCLLYLPVYAKNVLLKTVEQRRSAILGFVYAPFRMNDLMEGILGNRKTMAALRIFDGETPTQESLMYDSHRKEPPGTVTDDHTRIEPMAFAGHRWSLEFRSTQEFHASKDLVKPNLILFGGGLFSLLLFGFVHSTTQARNRAVRLAEKMTADLTLSESRTRAILETAVNGIITMGSDCKILTFNPAAERMFGYQVSEVVGRNVNLLMPEPFHSQHDGYIDRYLHTGESHIIRLGGREVMGKRKDGRVFPLWLAVGEAQIEAERVFVGCTVDITRHKEAETQLVAAKEAAETSNRAKSDFLNIMSHELRTPLTVILGYLPLLMPMGGKLPAAKKVAAALADRPEAAEFDKLNEQVGKMAMEMKRNGDHLLTLINDLLDISKIEAGKLTLERRLLPVLPLVEEVVNSLRLKAEEKGLALHTQGEACMVFADEMRIKQILINLIGNALKFTEQGQIHIEVKPEAGMTLFQVKDSGIGIPPEELERVFDRFHQVDNSSTRKAGGTGLGLAITRKLVEIQGGAITVSSEPGRGSTFGFTLPNRENT